MIRIVVDGFGGDKAPEEIVKGAVMAAAREDIKIILTGDKERLSLELQKHGAEFEILHAPEVIGMDEEPALAVRSKKNSSLVAAARLLADGGADAFVSAGSTGALITAATLITGRIKGVKRPALAPLIPTGRGFSMLIDCGANAECKPEYLLQFGVMGSVYMSKMRSVEKPLVALLSNGEEEHKGTPMHREAYALLKESRLSFAGNMESSAFMAGGCDVLVSDGFTGNILLKAIEGTATALMGRLKGVFYKNTLTKLAALAVKSGFRELKNSMDAGEVGGVPLLGIARPVVKAHGASDARAICNAILQAKKYALGGVVEKLAEEFANEGS